MIGYLVTFGVISSLAGACIFLGSIASNVRGLNERGEALWPEKDHTCG